MIKTISERRKQSLMQTPKSTVIEKTALEFACVWYESCLSSGLLPSKAHKTQKAWARANFQKFIPHAIEHLTSMLSRNDINDLCKQEIHEAILERVNDPETITLENLSSPSNAEH